MADNNNNKKTYNALNEADEHLRNCRTYWANLTPDDVPQAKYNFNKVDPVPTGKVVDLDEGNQK